MAHNISLLEGIIDLICLLLKVPNVFKYILLNVRFELVEVDGILSVHVHVLEVDFDVFDIEVYPQH